MSSKTTPLTSLHSWPHARPAADNLQHPGHHLHRREQPEAALPGPALRPLLQRPQGSQHGRRGPRQHQGERQRAAGGRRSNQQGRGPHHHLGAARDVHHLHWDHHHAVHHDHPQAALATNHPGTSADQLLAVMFNDGVGVCTKDKRVIIFQNMNRCSSLVFWLIESKSFTQFYIGVTQTLHSAVGMSHCSSHCHNSQQTRLEWWTFCIFAT